MDGQVVGGQSQCRKKLRGAAAFIDCGPEWRRLNGIRDKCQNGLGVPLRRVHLVCGQRRMADSVWHKPCDGANQFRTRRKHNGRRACAQALHQRVCGGWTVAQKVRDAGPLPVDDALHALWVHQHCPVALRGQQPYAESAGAQRRDCPT